MSPTLTPPTDRVDPLDADVLREHLTAAGVDAIAIHCFQHLASTSAWLHQHLRADTDMMTPCLCITDEQNAGQGRRGRSWHGPAGNIAFSLYSRVQCEPAALGLLSLVTALAVCDALDELAPDDYGVKWPNDVLAGGRKLCGLLVDRVSLGTAAPAQAHGLISGIGINVLHDPLHASLGIGASSLAARQAVRGVSSLPTRNELIAVVVSRLLRSQQQFSRDGWAGFAERWQALDVLAGRVVRIEREAPLKGVASGIAEDGALIVRRDDGGEERVYHGEVSVRLAKG